MKANASKHKAISYGRMEEKEKQLREEVKKLLAQAPKKMLVGLTGAGRLQELG